MVPETDNDPRTPPQEHGQPDGEIEDLIQPAAFRPWREPGQRPLRVAATGLWLGALAGCTSLVFNMVGSLVWTNVADLSQHPLRLIQVYLTFPLGDAALRLNSGYLLGFGCVLYLATGMIYGMLFEWMLWYFLPRAGWVARLVVCSVLALVVWAVNFLAILSWLQPLLFGGSWIVELIPWWVAALTHLVFGWTMALVYPLGVSR